MAIVLLIMVQPLTSIGYDLTPFLQMPVTPLVWDNASPTYGG
jgi:hypothetical protein